MDRPIKDEIEVVHLKDGSRSSNRRSFRPLSIRPDNNQVVYTIKNSEEGRVNGYSNGYGSASDMEINDELPDDEADDLSDDAQGENLEDLPMPPSPVRKVNISFLFFSNVESFIFHVGLLFAGNDRDGTVRESTTYTKAASRVEDRRDAIGTAQKDSTNSAFSCPTTTATTTTAAATTAPPAAAAATTTTGKFDSCLKLSRRQNRFFRSQ
jgi:hypothetical protein